MKDTTEQLWAKQNAHPGDRHRLFAAVGMTSAAAFVLYPGSFVDIAPSFVFRDVVYVDTDRRAAAFFADTEGVRRLIEQNNPKAFKTFQPRHRFMHVDYAGGLSLQEQSFDLLVSLYAGFVSEHCTQFLRIGGLLLVNPSHGDAAMASIDPRYRLAAVVEARDGDYRIRTTGLDAYLIPKSETQVTPELLHRLGRGVGYTRSPYAYLFERLR